MDAKHGHFVWYEHLTRDPTAAIAFYTDVVGWKTQPFEAGGDYVMWMGSQGPLGGVHELPAAPGVPPHWMAHVQVDDLERALSLVTKLGGKLHEGPIDIPTVGCFAVIADPQGAVISIFKPLGAMTRHDQAQDGEICWRELLTHDSAAAFEFYTQLFGWKILEAMDMGAMGKYRIYGLDGERMGGMMTMSKEMKMPPAWLYYINVSDLEGALGRAKARGAKVANGPMDIPGGGRIAQLFDPQGAAFALHRGPQG